MVPDFMIVDGGQQYLLATDVGLYVGHVGRSSKPHKVLSLEKISQVQVLEATELLLVLADKTLWEYNLGIVNNAPENQPPGLRIETNVPYFHVGNSLGRTLVCIPQVSALESRIRIFEPLSLEEFQNKFKMLDTSKSQDARNKKLLNKLVRKTVRESCLKEFKEAKECYIPSEAWAVELSHSQMLITCPRGVMIVDMKTKKPQRE